MNDRFYLAMLAGGALFLSGLAGCDTGDQGDPGDPGSPDPDTTAMYGEEETDDTGTDTFGETGETGTERDTTMGQTTDPARDPYATGGEQTGAVAGLESMSDQEVVGMTVISREGEEIGSIEEVATEGGGGMGQDKLAVVDVGGFLGIGEKSIAIPFSDLELSQDGRIQSDLTREALQSQPEFQGGGQTGQQQQPVQDQTGQPEETGQQGEQLE